MKKLFLLLALCIVSFSFAQEENSAQIQDAIKLMKLSNSSVETALQPIYMQVPEENLESFKMELKPVLDNMYTKLAKVAIKEYSHEDIKAMLKFYESELGQTMLAGQDKIMQASMQVGQELSMELMPIFQKYMQD